VKTDPTYLGQPLPFPGRFRWGYQHYPAYSWSWFKGRSWVFLIGVFAWGLVSSANVVLNQSLWVGIQSFAGFFAAFAIMTTVGPGLASLARHSYRSDWFERVLVIGALVFGLVTATIADNLSSNFLIELLQDNHSELELLADSENHASDPFQYLATNLLVMVIYCWMGGVFALPRYLREEINQLRVEKHQTAAKLSVLQAQVEPHFLFNTLASVKGTIREDPALAESTIDALVDYLRATIPKLRRQAQNDSTLGAQFQLCERYLAVMRLRMSDRLSYQSHLPSELHELPFPPLLLISLVENAIKHGIEPKPAGGNVALSARREGDTLLVKVVDDGVGLQHDSRAIEPSSGLGVGLRNVHQQLKALYGEKAKFTLSSQGVGAIAELSFPL